MFYCCRYIVMILVSVLCFTLLITGLIYSQETVRLEKFNMSITFPERWEVHTDMPAPLVLGADNYKNGAHIAITFMENYADKTPSRGYMKGILKETEKRNYKETKPNYERLSMDDYNVAGKEAVWMEFISADSSGDFHEVVVVFPIDRKYFIFAGMRCYEGVFSEVEEEFKGVLESIVFH